MSRLQTQTIKDEILPAEFISKIPPEIKKQLIEERNRLVDKKYILKGIEKNGIIYKSTKVKCPHCKKSTMRAFEEFDFSECMIDIGTIETLCSKCRNVFTSVISNPTSVISPSCNQIWEINGKKSE